MPELPKVVTVFGNSRPRESDPAYAEARTLGAALASRGFVVCSGGYGGTMEAVSRGAHEAGGRVLAVTADFFGKRANRWVDEEIRVADWQERLFELIRRGDGYVAVAGGTGTLVELSVVWEMINKRVMPPRPLVALGEFWRPIVERVREVEAEPNSPWGEAGGPLIEIADSPEAAAALLAAKFRAL